MEYKNLLDVSIINDKTVDEFEGFKKYVATGDIQDNKIINYDEVTYDSKPSRANREVEIGDILVAKMKETVKVLKITEENYDKYIFSTGFCTLKSKNERLDSDYFYKILISEYFQEQKDKYSKGATQKAINNSGLNKIKIPVPPMDVQKQIVEVLDKAQNLINNRKAQIKLLEDLIESIFYNMFGDPVMNQMKWTTYNVEDVCEKIVGGGTPSKSKPEYYVGKIPWVTPKDMKVLNIVDSQDHINDLAIQNSSTKLIPSGSLLMVIRSGILKRYLPLALNSVDVTINQDMKAFLIDSKKINKYFFLHFWMLAQRFILSKVRAVTADNIEFKQIKEMQIIMPPINLQNEFAEKVEAIESQKQLLEDSLKLLKNNYNGLMQRAFKGELF
ncbi:restriction endonuclease subunit S [Clostridium algidicarnis]|uniref:restriction endonuclease subunit S n=1 Tax=Clostridium algidicarnis TaxID=37659 RepID=UPI001C0BFE6C|nr:restriction endonuclease subunit S [Clostridium algidicarnis]MBU3209864.1 restriction endonuclease subunit S [Clostridium algidicarnis]